jgi:four helix bundle protein
MRIALKEFKETRISLKIVSRKNWINDQALLNKVMREAEELIAIFAKSVLTAKKNSKTVA